MSLFQFHNRLRYYREMKAFSQEELSRRSGVAETTISRIERSKTKLPHPNTRKRLAKALNVEVMKVFRPLKFR